MECLTESIVEDTAWPRDALLPNLFFGDLCLSRRLDNLYLSIGRTTNFQSDV